MKLEIKINELKTELIKQIAENKISTIKWMVGFLLGQSAVLIGAIIALIK